MAYTYTMKEFEHMSFTASQVKDQLQVSFDVHYSVG
jgi:hypothetical protein